jgi:hypothetical protein
MFKTGGMFTLPISCTITISNLVQNTCVVNLHIVIKSEHAKNSDGPKRSGLATALKNGPPKPSPVLFGTL